jgi:CHAT domain-containing protein/tetratricopeptide (TPR) repeat protein
MVRVLFGVFFFFFQLSFSQADSIKIYYEKGKIDKAIEFGEKFIKNKPVENIDYILVLNDLAAVYSHSNKFDLAEKTYYEKHRMLIKLFGENNSALAKNYNDIGNMFVANKKYVKAKESFIKSIEILTEKDNYKKDIYLKYLIDLALIYFELNELDKAEEFHLLVYKLQKEKLQKENAILHINFIDKIALMKERKNELLEANKYYLESLELKKLYFGENVIDIAIAHNNLALNYKSIDLNQKAEAEFLNAIELRKKNNGENHIDFIILLNNLADLYVKLGDFQKAENIYKKSIDLSQISLKEDHFYYSTSIDYLITLFINQKKYKEAEPLYLKSLEIKKKVLGDNHPDYIKKYESFAYCNKELFKYKEAESIYLKILDNHKKTSDKPNRNFINTLNRLALLYEELDQIDKVEPLYIEALKVCEKLYSKNDLDYLQILNNLGSFYIVLGQFNKSKLILLETLESRKKILGENHLDVAISYNNLGTFYLKVGDFYKAEAFILKALEIRKNILGKSNELYLSTIDNLVKLKIYQGKIHDAEILCLESIGTFKLVFGENHPKYSSFINGLASIYKNQGEKNKAELLLLQSLEINKKVFGIKSIKYSDILNNLATFYIENGDLKKGENLLLESLNITKGVFGENHIEYAISLNNLAFIIQNKEKKEQFYLQSLNIIKNYIGKDNDHYAIYLNNLATFYDDNGDFQKAESFYIESLNIFKKIVGEFHSKYITVLKNITLLYSKNNNLMILNDRILEYTNKWSILFQSNAFEILSYLSEEQIRKYRLKYFFERFQPISFLQTTNNKYPFLNTNILNTELLLKNLTLRNQQRIKKSIEQSNDSVLKEKYEQFVANKRFLTKLEEQTIDKRPENYETLKAETEILEKDITRLSSTFAEGKKSLLVTWQDVQQKLKPNEVVIDLVSYNYYNKKWTDSIMYGAFVFDKTSKFPKFVSLFEEKQLTQLLERDSHAKDSIQEKIINKQYADKSISDLFLKPLEKELQNAKTIYVTPSGLAHQINFKALPFQNTTFGETFSVHILGSSAAVLNLASNHLSKNKNLEFHLFGGIDYNKVSKEETLPSENQIVSRSSISSFGYLQGTEKEVNEIAKTAQNQGFKTILKTEKNATEESIKLLDSKKAPFILHIATHGFFFENPKVDVKQFSLDNKFSVYKTSDDPMLRSGLAFAGANKNFKSTIIENEADDGILTAKEISNLDLSACELVVLSACETGLGELNGSEGVFGLQRAFKMAGVKNIIMSLWKVPDAQTSELFEIFYKELFNGNNIKTAFENAQNKMKAKYSPYYWAGFVLLE